MRRASSSASPLALNKSFSRKLYERKEVTAALQDGSREWIALLVCICADGTKIPPAIIYQGKGALRSG
jgi:hypothetical protein